MVARSQGSCLGVLRGIGMDDSCYGSENGGKRREKGQIWRDIVVQKDGDPEQPLMGESA